MMDVYRASLRQSASMQRGSMSGTSDYDMCVNRGATANNYGDASGYSPRARVNINSANPYTRNQPQPYGHVTDGAPGALGYGQQMSEREREFIRNKPPRQTVTQSAWLSPRELHTHTHTHTHTSRLAKYPHSLPSRGTALTLSTAFSLDHLRTVYFKSTQICTCTSIQCRRSRRIHSAGAEYRGSPVSIPYARHRHCPARGEQQVIQVENRGRNRGL